MQSSSASDDHSHGGTPKTQSWQDFQRTRFVGLALEGPEMAQLEADTCPRGEETDRAGANVEAE
jgi:hypothetical protein